MMSSSLPKSIFSLKTFKVLVSSKNIIGNLRRIRNEIYFKSLYKDLIKIMKDHSKNNESNIIVHTKRDKKTIERFFDFKNVHDFPLTFLNKEERLRERNISERNGFIDRYSLNKNDKIIGIFGYISEYKGHETIIKALSYLPDDYKLLIFGSQHPMSIQEYKSCDDYIEKLLKLIESISKNKNSFNERIQFLGNLDDDRFIEALYCCDFAVLPYLEVNQGGSGIASLVLETKIKALYSNNKAFDELNKYFANTFSRFDIGNYMELAKKIKDYKENYTLKIDDCLETYNIEKNIIFHKNIFEGGMKK